MSRNAIAALSFFAGLLLAPVAVPAGEIGQVWKSPTCGCCKIWVGYMQSKGFALSVKDTSGATINQIKSSAGVAQKFAGCHSAKIAGYMIEGHVPAEDIARLIAEKPDAIGLSVPGMPVGSPGMETDGTVEPFDVLLMKKDGTSEVFSHYGADAKF